MEIFLRFIGAIIMILGVFLRPIIVFWTGAKKEKVPPIRNKLLKIPAIDLATKIRNQEIKSEDVVRAYIDRIKEVNPILNAVIDDRFDDAIKDAQRADQMCSVPSQREVLLVRFPLLGIPFTVKESCAVKGLSFVVGNIHRKGLIAPEDGEVVELLKSAGAIPLLVSANPEFCVSWETNTVTHGCCRNPYDTTRTPGGSSGGEGALNGCGASLFGIGSDIAGSIRVPALFNGVFGHKPTGGLLSVKGHFPSSSDPNFEFNLQIGPITRFARDLPLLLQVMAGKNAQKLELSKVIDTKDIKIFYMEDNGFTFTYTPVTFHIKLSILQAVEHFRRNGLSVNKAKTKYMNIALETSLSMLMGNEDVPSILVPPKDTGAKNRDNVYSELLKYFYGKTDYSFAGLCFEAFYENNGLIPKSRQQFWNEKLKCLKEELMELLGNDGVLLLPTFQKPAFHHNTSVINLAGVTFSAVMNAIGFPATHIPMGLDNDGLPIGFQVVAALYQDKLCFQIAGELEAAFGGWVPPS